MYKRVHCPHRIKATDDKMTFKDSQLSVVVRYGTNTRKIWQATELKSEDRSHQTIMDMPTITSKEMTRVARRLVTSATITYRCMSQSPGPLPAHTVLLWLPKKLLRRSFAPRSFKGNFLFAPTNILPILSRSNASVNRPVASFLTGGAGVQPVPIL